MKEATASPKDDALKLALEALEKSTKYFNIVRLGESRLKDTEIRGASHAAIIAIKEALAQDELCSSQEPVATINDLSNSKMFTLEANGYSRKDNLYTSPPKRPWVGLTEENFQAIKGSLFRQDLWDGYGWDLALKEAIEAKLKEKNT